MHVRYRVDWFVNGRWGKGIDFGSMEELKSYAEEDETFTECRFRIVEVTTTVEERVL